jgi:hypothetical protein
MRTRKTRTILLAALLFVCVASVTGCSSSGRYADGRRTPAHRVEDSGRGISVYEMVAINKMQMEEQQKGWDDMKKEHDDRMNEFDEMFGTGALDHGTDFYDQRIMVGSR